MTGAGRPLHPRGASPARWTAPVWCVRMRAGSAPSLAVPPTRCVRMRAGSAPRAPRQGGGCPLGTPEAGGRQHRHAIAACPSAPRAGEAVPTPRPLPGSFAENEVATAVAAERLSVGKPERAGRNQRARATALGQGSSPSLRRGSRSVAARHWLPAWGPGARPLARGVSGGVRTPPDKASGARGAGPGSGCRQPAHAYQRRAGRNMPSARRNIRSARLRERFADLRKGFADLRKGFADLRKGFAVLRERFAEKLNPRPFEVDDPPAAICAMM